MTMKELDVQGSRSWCLREVSDFGVVGYGRKGCWEKGCRSVSVSLCLSVPSLCWSTVDAVRDVVMPYDVASQFQRAIGLFGPGLFRRASVSSRQSLVRRSTKRYDRTKYDRVKRMQSRLRMDPRSRLGFHSDHSSYDCRRARVSVNNGRRRKVGCEPGQRDS